MTRQSDNSKRSVTVTITTSSCIGAFALLCSMLAMASPESEALKRDGLAELKANRYEQAVEQFRKATQADPADRDAAFYLAATYNRMGRHADAYIGLKALEAIKYRNAELDFEIGWSLMGLGRAQTCVIRLERYEKNVPGRALAAEFLGRCLTMLGRYAEAETRLREALARDPASKSRVDLLLAQLQHARGDKQAANASIDAIMRGDSDIGRALRDGQAALAGLAPPPETGLRFVASAAIGYNDNVIGLGNTQPLPTDISSKGSAFTRASFGVSNTVQFDPQTRGSVGYGLLIDRYDELKIADLDDHFIYADVAHRVNESLAVSLRVSQQFTYLDGSHFRTQPSIRPAVAYRFAADSVTEAAYIFAKPDYKGTAANPVFERDGDIHVWSLSHLIQPPDSPWSGSLGYAHTANRAEGADFASRSDGFSAALRYSFDKRTTLTLGANVGQSRYDNPNSLTGFVSTRRDKPTSLFAQFNGPLTDKLRYYLQFQSSRSHSNITFYDYQQQVLLGGVAVDF